MRVDGWKSGRGDGYYFFSVGTLVLIGVFGMLRFGCGRGDWGGGVVERVGVGVCERERGMGIGIGIGIL